MRIVLTAIEDNLAEAWERHCGDLPNVTVHRGSILDLSVDAVVSPANSFGFMDGGIDHRYSHHFGWEVQDRLQQLIRSRHRGELLVGNAEILEYGKPLHSVLDRCATMRVPMTLRDSINPYLAARAAFLLIQHGVVADGAFVGERVETVVTSVAFPGLGTGVGQVGPNTCARQVRAAIEATVLGRGIFPVPGPRPKSDINCFTPSASVIFSGSNGGTLIAICLCRSRGTIAW